MMSVLPPPPLGRDSPMSIDRIAPPNQFQSQSANNNNIHNDRRPTPNDPAAADGDDDNGDKLEIHSLDNNNRHPPSNSASSVHSEQTERSMTSTVAAATPTAPGPAMVTTTPSVTEGAKKLSPSASSTLAPPRTTSPRASPTLGTSKPLRPHVSTARNSPAAPTAAADTPQPPPSSAPAASGPGATSSTESAAPSEKLNSASSGVGGNGNAQLPSPPLSTPTAAGAAVTAANVSAPGGVISLHDSKSPASAAKLVGGAVPPSSTAGSRTASSPSHHTQHPHPPASAAEPPPPSSVTNRAPESMRRPYAARSDRYPTLDVAHQRIGDLEDETRTLRYELDRARLAPPSSSSAVVSAAVVDSVLAAFSVYERESVHLEARSREARENFARVLSGLIGHSRGRDRDVLSSAMIPVGERDWRNSPTEYRHLPHTHHGLQRAQSSPVFLPQSAPSHHAERGHPLPQSSSRHTDQHGYPYLPSRPSPRPTHDRSQPQPPPVINLPPSNSTSSHHGHHSRTGSNTIPSGFDLMRERKERPNNFTREHASGFAQTGEKRPRAPSFGAEAPGSGRDRREGKRLRVSREGDWVKRGSSSPNKDEEHTNGNGDDFPSPRKRDMGLPSKGGASTAGWARDHQAAARGLASGAVPLPTDGAEEAEGEDAMGSPDSGIAAAAGLQPKRDKDEALDDEMLVLVGERPMHARRESTATGTGRGEETDGEVDEMILETVGATASDRPHRRDPYANDRERWHDEYAARYARDREGSAKPLGYHPSSGSSHSPVNSYPSPAHHHQHGSDRDRGYIFRNMHPGGMESISQQRGSVSFPHPPSAGSESAHMSSRGAIYPPGQEPPNSTGGSRVPHFLPPQLGPPQPKKIYHSKSITLPPGNASIPGGPGGATAGPPGPGGNAIRGPGPGPPNGQPVRKCKSCNEPGRYKDGRCVEKWGPGPHGPGTVCDRCRKKMKRVEKRSGMEAAAAAAQNSLATGGHGVHYVQGHPYPRVDHPPERSGPFAMSQQDEYSQSTVALDDPQSQAYEGRSQGYYGQDHYRSDRMPPPPHRHHLARRESSHSGSSQELHRDERGRRSGLPFHHDAPLTGGGASSAGGEYNTVLPPRRQRADGDSYREEREQERERERRAEGEQRDANMRNSREDEDDDADGDAEMDQLEEDLVDPGRNKVKKEDS